jgi:hypothetical protein
MNTTTTAIIGQVWPEQGGIFVGSRLIDGQLHHIIASDRQHEIAKVSGHTVASISIDEIEGHADWHAGDQEDLMLAYINAREHFEREGYASIYWSRTVDKDGDPWAVDFEYGCVDSRFRFGEFRVRPFRSILASSL